MSHDCSGQWPAGGYVGTARGASAPSSSNSSSSLSPLVRQLGDSSDRPLAIDAAALSPEIFTTSDGVVLTDADGNPYGSN